VDFDGDGRTDIISGSWPGHIYFFRRQVNGQFAEGQIVKDKDGKPIRVGSAAAAFAVDWDGNGTIDLLVGNMLGEVYFVPNEGKGKELVFGTPLRLEAAGQPIKVTGEAAPTAVDWDNTGKLDLIVGTDEGEVLLYRNVGIRTKPALEKPVNLLGKSPVGWKGDDSRGPGDWGLRVKPCVVDWRGDGRPDLLIGDLCGGFNAKPSQTEAEKAEERKANDQLPELRGRWSEAFKHYRKASTAPAHESVEDKSARLRTLDTMRHDLERFREEISRVEQIQEQFQPGYQYHGFVWHFERLPAKKGR
jgi:hypothetical protein